MDFRTLVSGQRSNEGFGNIYLPRFDDVAGLSPAVYKIVKVKNDWSLELAFEKFTLPKKIYGKMHLYKERIFRRFDRYDESLGILLLGLKGSGKTEMASLLSNEGLSRGMPVILVTDIRPDQKLGAFITKLDNCVIFMDEFAKVFNYQLQSTLLTMFSDLNKTKKLFILTENNKNSINPFLLDRPARLRYKIEFKKVPLDVVEEYCKDNDVKEEFMKEFIPRYEKANEFTFDHLQGIISEYKDYPDASIDDLLEIMNLDLLNKIPVMVIDKVTDEEGNDYIAVPKEFLANRITEPYIYTNIQLEKIQIDGDGGDGANLMQNMRKTIVLSNDKITTIIGEDYTFDIDGITIKAHTEMRDEPPKKVNPINNMQPPMNQGKLGGFVLN